MKPSIRQHEVLSTSGIRKSFRVASSDFVIPCLFFAASALLAFNTAVAQEFSVHAVEDRTDKPLRDIPITLRYNCTPVGQGLDLKWKGCKWITRRTDKTGAAHFPEAGSLPDLDDVYSLPIAYGMTCCDVQPKTFPSEATMKFHKRTLAEQLH